MGKLPDSVGVQPDQQHEITDAFVYVVLPPVTVNPERSGKNVPDPVTRIQRGKRILKYDLHLGPQATQGRSREFEYVLTKKPDRP